MDYRAAGFWWAVGQGVFNLTVVIWLAVSRKNQANNKLVKDLEESNAKKIDEKKAKELIREHVPACPNTLGLSEVNARLEALPSQQSIERLSNNIGRLEGRLDSVDRVAALMNEFLINQGNKQ